jgi:hypothetical protein
MRERVSLGMSVSGRRTDLREIGDLLGHQDPMTTSLYADVTVFGMRVLVHHRTQNWRNLWRD